MPEDPGMILGKCLRRTFSESGGEVFGEFHRPGTLYGIIYKGEGVLAVFKGWPERPVCQTLSGKNLGSEIQDDDSAQYDM